VPWALGSLSPRGRLTHTSLGATPASTLSLWGKETTGIPGNPLTGADRAQVAWTTPIINMLSLVKEQGRPAGEGRGGEKSS
jgi:hypothetical protein